MAVTTTAEVAAQMLPRRNPVDPNTRQADGNVPTFSFTPFLLRNYAPQPAKPSFDGENKPLRLTVCKHWLRGLCKKGDTCDYLHEYNLRKMPECNFYARNGYCSNGDECLYLHIDPETKLVPCPHFENGFCPLGPRCGKKHVQRTLCTYYLAGFCPDGRQCKVGTHPKWHKNLDEPTSKGSVVTGEPAEVAKDRRSLMDDDEESMVGDKTGGWDREHNSDWQGPRDKAASSGRGGRWRGRATRQNRGRY